MSVKLSHLILSGLFLLMQTHEIKASDDSLRDDQKKLRASHSTSTKKSTKSKKFDETSSTMTEGTKADIKKKTSPLAVNSTFSSLPASDLLGLLISKPLQPKVENFVIPQTLDIYETLLVLFAGQDKSKNNKIYFADRGMACSLGSLETGTTLELETFLHAAKVKENEGFVYLKDMLLIEDSKAEVITTRAEKIFKGEQTQLEDIEKTRQKFKNSRTTLGYLLTDSRPGDHKDKNLHNITAKYEISEKRPHATLADHNSFQAKYSLYLDDVKTKFSFWLNLYRMKVK